MILLRIIQAAFLVYLAVIVFTFFKDYVRNKEADYPRRTNLINYVFGFINYVLDALGISGISLLLVILLCYHSLGNQFLCIEVFAGECDISTFSYK